MLNALALINSGVWSERMALEASCAGSTRCPAAFYDTPLSNSLGEIPKPRASLTIVARRGSRAARSSKLISVR